MNHFRVSGNSVIITDWHWFNEHATDIHQWLLKNTVLGPDVCCKGISVRFEKDEELTAFLLVWSDA